VVGKAAHMMIVMKGWPCQRVDEATQAESRGGDDTYRISCDSQRHIYRLVTPSSGELVVERW
jgi:hypothetical protein